MHGSVHDDRLNQPSTPTASAGAGTWAGALPQPRHWLPMGIVLCAAVVALGVAVQLVPGDTAAELGVDQTLSLHHVAVLTAVAMGINLLFGPGMGLLLIAVAALVIWVLRRNLVTALAFGLTACSGWVASEAFKLVFNRQRPNPALLFDPLAPETGSNSFPSGHVSFAVALTFALYFLARRTHWAKPVAVAGAVVALIVAWSRLYVGVHYVSDVAASFFTASAAAILLAGLWNRFAPALVERVPARILHPSRRA